MTKEGQFNRIRRLMKRAQRTLRTARSVLKDEDYASAVNRAYYAIFYAANAALSTQNVERHKHTGIISEFRQRFIRTGLIEREYSAFTATRWMPATTVTMTLPQRQSVSARKVQ